MTRKEMKQVAKAGIRDTRPHPMLVTLVFLLITTGVNLAAQVILMQLGDVREILNWMEQGYSFYEVMYYYLGTPGATALVFVNILIGLYGMVVNFGYLGYTLRVSRRENARYGNLLEGFGLAGRVILLNILIDLFISLWFLLIVPGFIAFYRYRMAYYILLDDPNCGALEAIRRSKALMRGHKFKLFVFDLSFLNWFIIYIPIYIAGGLLGNVSYAAGMILTTAFSAVLSLWIFPYFCCSQAMFYDNLFGGDTRQRRNGRGYGPEIRF